MAINNKWKTSLDDTPSSEEQISNTLLDENSNTLTIRSDWTMQRKMGVAMGVVGAILVLVGIAPMVIDTNTLKGDSTAIEGESSQGGTDPLVALLMGGSTTTNSTNNESDETSNTSDTMDTSEETNPDPIATTSTTTSTTGDETVITETIVLNTENTENSGMTSSQNNERFENTTGTSEDIGTEGITTSAMNTNFETTSMNTENNPLQNEVNAIINTANTTTFNTNTGLSDTIGEEFMTENPTATTPLIPTDNASFHGAAPLQNTTSTHKNTQLANSGPSDTALLLFILSLFVGGGVRYFRKF